MENSSEPTTESTITSENDKGLVALLDVLGFKGLDESEQIRVCALLEQAVDKDLPKMWRMYASSFGRWLQTPIVRMFSDTIIVTFPRTKNGPVAQDLFHFVNNYLGMLFCLLLEDGITLRGAIGYGTISQRKYSIVGSAIIDAGQEYEQTSWAGIHYTAAATAFTVKWHQWAHDNKLADDRRLFETSHNLNQTQFYVAEVPFKATYAQPKHLDSKAASQRFVVPWPKDLRYCLNAREIISHSYETMHSRIHAVLDRLLAQHTETRKREILSNTIAFADKYLLTFPDVNKPIEWAGPLPPME